MLALHISYERKLREEARPWAHVRGEAFIGFLEPGITFRPTFKVKRQVGVDYNDQRRTSIGCCGSRRCTRRLSRAGLLTLIFFMEKGENIVKIKKIIFFGFVLLNTMM